MQFELFFLLRKKSPNFLNEKGPDFVRKESIITSSSPVLKESFKILAVSLRAPGQLWLYTTLTSC